MSSMYQDAKRKLDVVCEYDALMHDADIETPENSSAMSKPCQVPCRGSLEQSVPYQLAGGSKYALFN
jgi:hypothetical protein